MMGKKISVVSRMGGKYQLIDHIVPLVEDCAKKYNLTTYAELCGGGARILLNLPPLLFQGKIYNEIDKGLCSIFEVLQNKLYTAEMMSFLEKLRYNETTFQMARQALQADEASENLSLVERATCMYIVLSQSRAAIMKNYSPAKENDMSYYHRVSRLKDYHHILEDISIYNTDCMELLESYKEKQEMLIYLDPPYIPHVMKNPKTYDDFSWSVEKHRELVEVLLGIKAKVILSGYDEDEGEIGQDKIYLPLEQAGWLKLKLKKVHVASGAKGDKKNEYIWCNFTPSRYVLHQVTTMLDEY